MVTQIGCGFSRALWHRQLCECVYISSLKGCVLSDHVHDLAINSVFFAAGARAHTCHDVDRQTHDSITQGVFESMHANIVFESVHANIGSVTTSYISLAAACIIR